MKSAKKKYSKEVEQQIRDHEEHLHILMDCIADEAREEHYQMVNHALEEVDAEYRKEVLALDEGKSAKELHDNEPLFLLATEVKRLRGVLMRILPWHSQGKPMKDPTPWLEVR